MYSFNYYAAPHVNSHPIENNNKKPPPPHVPHRLISTTKNNSAPEFQFDNTNESVHESTSEPTPRLQSDEEREENVGIEMQTEQSKHVSRKRSWLVDVIGKLESIHCKLTLYLFFMFVLLN